MGRVIGIVGLVLGIALLVGAADAKKKVHKLVACESFGEAKDDAGVPFAVCFDAEKPMVLPVYQVATIANDSGVPVKVVVGWR